MTAGRVVVYGAPDCSLCEPAKETVREVARRLGVPVQEVDISGDEVLERRYRPRLPVVEIDGRTAFVYAVDAGELEDALRAAGGAQGEAPHRPS
jgi:glutaredoxin